MSAIAIDRLEMIALINPEWAIKICEFLENYPEFQKYRHIASLQDRPNSSGEEWMPKTLFEHVLYYICASGVRYTYAISQFKIVVNFLRSDWIYITSNIYTFLSTNNIQPKKKSIYWNTLLWMYNRNITKDTLTYENILSMKYDVVGIGDGLVAYITTNYTNYDTCLQYTDINFCKGFEKVYGIKDKSSIKQKCEEYTSRGFGRVANSLMFQISHYA